jgi:RNA polymerase-associated protein
MSFAYRRASMTLYSHPMDPYSHQVRIVLAEKGVSADIKSLAGDELPEELLELNPYGTLPTLVDRDLSLYQASIIMEYLEERFPHPPLLPVYPVSRARSRRMMFRIEQDWYSLMRTIMANEDSDDVYQAQRELEDHLVSLAPVFAHSEYFLSEEFSLVDCYLAPLLWRLPQLGIKLESQAQAVKDYAERIFEREAFKTSLTVPEKELWVA